MLDSAPGYYQYSKVYEAIQAVQGDDYDNVEAANEDLRKQLYIITATWGLIYWEEVLEIPTVETDSDEIRRSRILSQWRGIGNFSAGLIESIAEAFINGDVAVSINIPTQQVTVTFIGTKGIPPNVDDLKAQIANIIHAHLGVDYVFTYITWDELDPAVRNWDYVDAQALTWDEFEIWTP